MPWVLSRPQREGLQLRRRPPAHAPQIRRIAITLIHPVRKQHVKMRVQVQRTAEAIDQGDHFAPRLRAP